MRRGLVTGLIIGGVLGVYYGLTVSNRERRRLNYLADDLLERGSDVMDMVRDKAVRTMG